MVGVLFALWVPRGSIPLLIGMFLLELGSVCMTSSKIIPGILSDGKHEPHSDLRWDRVYWVGMTISNVLCMGCCFYNAYLPFDMPHRTAEKACKVFFTLLTLGLCYMRQLWSNHNMYTAHERYNELNPYEKIHHDDKLISDEVAAVLAGLFGAVWCIGSVASFHYSYRTQGYNLYPLKRGDKKPKQI
jgi:hypothetical protein